MNFQILQSAEDEVTADVSEAQNLLMARHNKRKEATQLIRVVIVCNNPAKLKYPGETFGAGNSTVGTHKRYVPFNNQEGWHVPLIILNTIKERMCPVTYEKEDIKGRSTSATRLIPEFTVTELPPLTPKAIQELAMRQKIEKSIDNVA